MLEVLKSSQPKDVSWNLTMDNGKSKVQFSNPHLKDMKEDVLYHLGLGSGSHDLKKMFGDVKFVCMGGTPQRMEAFAHYIMEEMGLSIPTGTCLFDISKHSHRYAMYKVGPVLSVSHGMGVPSLSILLHELIKLVSHAGAVDPIFIRIGTCGGIGLEGGTVVVTTEALNPMLKPVHQNIVLGEIQERPTHLDKNVADELFKIGGEMPFNVAFGKTMCTDDFYEGQGRIDGAFCEYSLEDKLRYLEKLNAHGVKNIEMEASCFAAMTHRAGIRAAIVCVAILNRLNGDQVTSTKAELTEFQTRPQQLVARFIQQRLNMDAKPSRVIRDRSSSKFFGTCQSCFEDIIAD